MERRNRKELAEEPATVHVWLSRITGCQTKYAVRARYVAAQEWVEHLAGCPDAEWRNAESGMQHFVDEDGAIKGIVEPVELPEVTALLIEEGDNSSRS